MQKDIIRYTLSLLDCNNGWYQHTDNKNCFTDKINGQCLYLYEDHLKYWNDIRVHSSFETHPLTKGIIKNIILNHELS